MVASVPIPTLSLTEAQGFTALRSFLIAVCNPSNIDVVRAENNLVPEPKNTDFIVMTPLMQERLETNEVTYQDNVFVGSISGNVLTVVSVTQGSLAAGMLLIDDGYPTMRIAVNTIIVNQLTGPTGGAGNYSVNNSQTLAQETLYAGVRADFEATKWTVQLDVHGPNSGNNTKVIEALFRSEYATAQFALSGFDVVPLYCSDPRQAPFINAEQQYEYRWTLDAVMQINSVIGTPQQFATEVEVTVIEAGVNYTGGP